MQRTTAVLAVACLALAACSHSFQRRAPLVATPEGFNYRADCPSICDLTSPEAEQQRLRDLEAQLAQARMCPKGYVIEKRSAHGVTLNSPPDIVLYDGRCR